MIKSAFTQDGVSAAEVFCTETEVEVFKISNTSQDICQENVVGYPQFFKHFLPLSSPPAWFSVFGAVATIFYKILSDLMTGEET